MDGLLRSLGVGSRLGLTALCLVLVGGLVASGLHLRNHDAPRDGNEALSLEDITSAYRGLDQPAPIARALDRGHPEGLAEPKREALREWIRGGASQRDFDDESHGELAPAAILDADCVSCHSRDATDGDGIGQTVPLFYFDDVRKQAIGRSLAPTPTDRLVQSTHAHALTLGVLGLVIGALGLGTRLPRRVVGSANALLGLGLLADLAGWWLTRWEGGLVWLILAGGIVFSVVAVLVLIAVIVDLWLPGRAAPGD